MQKNAEQRGKAILKKKAIFPLNNFRSMHCKNIQLSNKNCNSIIDPYIEDFHTGKTSNLNQSWPEQIDHQNPELNPCCFSYIFGEFIPARMVRMIGYK
jgi:hypothetical protein